MTIERWNPFREILARSRWFDRFAEDFMEEPGFNLAVDLVETDKGYEVQASVPGFKPEEIQIDVKEDIVTIRGEHKEEKEEKKENYLYRERRSGSFYRQLRLPNSVDSAKTVAELKDGVLKLELPKTEQTTAQHIPVKVGSK